MRTGTRIGVDVGTTRVGVARSDALGLMAVPVATLPRSTAIDELVLLAAEYDAIEFVCGLPLSLDGSDTASTLDARQFAAELSAATGVPVRLVDERLTTVTAQHALHDASHSTKSGRAMIDQVAATIVLDSALNAERAGNTIGETVGES
jgi:putative Holliday junction resolvase